jgi:hypothetical protein
MSHKTSKIQAAALSLALLLPSASAFAKSYHHHSKLKGAVVGGAAGAAVAGKKGAVAGGALGALHQHHKNKKMRG